jgi:ABC-type xylose transport system permease subunit
MNQGIAFARTIRALNADDFRGSKFSLLIAAILLAAWAWWMLAARIPQYQTTSNVRLESGGAIAYFPSTNQIHPGQMALVTIASGSIPARVQTVAADHAELVFTNNQPPATASTSAVAEIETTRVSPAAIALQTLTRARQ